MDFVDRMPEGGPAPQRPRADGRADGHGQSRLPPAEELARKAIAAKPEDFERRVWLAVVLIEDRRLDEAKAVLRQAVDADKADPDRWSTLVRF